MPETPGGDEKRRIAIVVGGSQDVWTEYAKAKELCASLPLTVFAVNDMIARLPDPIDHAVTMHPAKLVNWLIERTVAGFPKPPRIWCQPPMRPVGRLNPRGGPPQQFAGVTDQSDIWGGMNSGIFAMKIARKLGFERIILCGVPLTMDAGHFVRKKPWKWAPITVRHTAPHVPEFKGFVRSMSGWTLQQFGFPDRAWLLAA